MPKSCLVQLRSIENTPDKLKDKINFQDGNSIFYSVQDELKKTICEQKEIPILKEWHKRTAMVESIEEFESEI